VPGSFSNWNMEIRVIKSRGQYSVSSAHTPEHLLSTSVFLRVLCMMKNKKQPQKISSLWEAETNDTEIEHSRSSASVGCVP
jgi:hypothetical protein